MSSVKLAESAGFCFGVKRAIEMAYAEIEKNDGEPLYSYGPLIHNKEVTNDLDAKGLHTKSNVCVCLIAQLCLTLCTPWSVGRQAPPSMGFSGQEYWSGLPFPPPENLPDPEIEPTYPVSPALRGIVYYWD